MDGLGGGLGVGEGAAFDPTAAATSNSRNLYVRGFPADWGEAELHAFFGTVGTIDSIRVSAAPAGARPGAGATHAFVRFATAPEAAAAIAALNGRPMDDGGALMVKLADSDVMPRVQSGQTPSEWVYVRNLPPAFGRDDCLVLFHSLQVGPVLDLKHFPSTEHYRCSGALAQLETVDRVRAAIAALNGVLLPGASQPLLARFADSPAEKAAKAARKDRLATARSASGPLPDGGGGGALGAAHAAHLHAQLLELTLRASSLGSPPPAPPGLAPLPPPPGLAAAGSAPLPLGSGSSGGGELDAAALGAAAAALAASAAGFPGLRSLSSLPYAPSPAAYGAPPAAPAARPPGGAPVYVRGLPEDADALWLYERFARFGAVLSVRALPDERTGRCSGIGFVNFADPDAARAAQEALNGAPAGGDRALQVVVQPAPGARSSGGSAGSGSSGGPARPPSASGGSTGGSSQPSYLPASAYSLGGGGGGGSFGAPGATQFNPSGGHF